MSGKDGDVIERMAQAFFADAKQSGESWEGKDSMQAAARVLLEDMQEDAKKAFQARTHILTIAGYARSIGIDLEQEAKR